MAAVYDSAVRNSLKGVTDSRYTGRVTHYRGIQYASIAERFARPILNTKWPGNDLDCTKFGARCPQPPTDVRDLMQIPRNLPQNDFDLEDELRCANLNITCPSGSGSGTCPVLLWIYGGSQMKSFGSAAQKLGDPGPLVAQSIDMGKPIVLVTIHYRLNIFGFGDGKGELNLGLQDQRAAIAWTKKYIDEFGGDPENITLGGESAGAIYTHALLATGSDLDVQRAILASASLYTTPPQPETRGFGILGLIEGNLQLMMEKGNLEPANAPGATLTGAPAKALVRTLQDLDITSMWMYQESELKDWQDDERVFGNLQGVMIGDCEYESVLWRGGISRVSAKEIAKCFVTNPAAHGKGLAEEYNVDSSDDKACRLAALDYLNDWKFAYPVQSMVHNINQAGGKAYRYQFDQVNPFAKLDAARAHHAVDLFAIFGGYDGFLNEDMREVGNTLRKNWITFVNGEEPWKKDNILGYGPNGRTTEMTENQAAPRRRQKQFQALAEAGSICQDIAQKLIAAIGSAASN